MIAKLVFFGWLFGGGAVTPDDLVGFYSVQGRGDTGQLYNIVAEVRLLDGAPHVRWTYAPNDHSFGHGFLTKDGRFIVGFYGSPLTGAAEYRKTKDGWVGEWSHDGHRYPERWIRRDGPTPAQQDEAPVGHPPIAQPGTAL